MSDYRTVYQPNMMSRRYVGASKDGPPRTSYQILMDQSQLLGKRALRMYAATRSFLHTATHPIQAYSAEQERQFFETHPDQIHEMVEQSQEILAGARTVILPSNMFRDTVTVDRMKVTITERTFFWSRRVVTLRIEDILNVSVSLGMFFGSLTVSTRVMNSTDHFEIDGFWNADALHLKHIIQGYAIAIHQGIDVSALSSERLVRKLSELGADPDHR